MSKRVIYLKNHSKAYNTEKFVLIKMILSDLIECVHVLATICDQDYNSVAEINKLLTNTNETCKRTRPNKRNVVLVIKERDVISISDPLHFLQGMCNNLLNKDVTFLQNNAKYKATWKDAVSHYNLDCQYEDKK